MIAAEARASGIPMFLPDGGAAADHLVPGAGHHYRAADASSLAAAIRLFLAQGPSGHLANASAAAIDTRTMDAHFADLFTLYEATRRSLPIAA